MEGFCSGSSIEIYLELSEAEIINLRSRTLTGNIRRGHEGDKKVGIELLVGDTADEKYMRLEILPEDADFENTTTYRITLSADSYGRLSDGQTVIDRPVLGTKVSVYPNKKH